MSRNLNPLLWERLADELADKAAASFVLDVLQDAIGRDPLIRSELLALIKAAS